MTNAPGLLPLKWQPVLTGKRILFIDDELSIRLTVPRILVKHGFEVTSIANLEDVCTEIKTQKFDVLLCDLNLPEEDAGFWVIEQMRKAQPGCVNFILTDNPSQSVQRVAGRGARFFIKPIDVEELVNVINEKLPDSPTPIPAATPGPRLKYPWQQVLLGVFMEGCAERLPARINAAERAIAVRLCDSTSMNMDEHAALQAALRTVRMLLPAREPRKESVKKDIA